MKMPTTLFCRLTSLGLLFSLSVSVVGASVPTKGKGLWASLLNRRAQDTTLVSAPTNAWGMQTVASRPFMDSLPQAVEQKEVQRLASAATPEHTFEMDDIAFVETSGGPAFTLRNTNTSAEAHFVVPLATLQQNGSNTKFFYPYNNSNGWFTYNLNANDSQNYLVLNGATIPLASATLQVRSWSDYHNETWDPVANKWIRPDSVGYTLTATDASGTEYAVSYKRQQQTYTYSADQIAQKTVGFYTYTNPNNNAYQRELVELTLSGADCPTATLWVSGSADMGIVVAPGSYRKYSNTINYGYYQCLPYNHLQVGAWNGTTGLLDAYLEASKSDYWNGHASYTTAVRYTLYAFTPNGDRYVISRVSQADGMEKNNVLLCGSGYTDYTSIPSQTDAYLGAITGLDLRVWHAVVSDQNSPIAEIQLGFDNNSTTLAQSTLGTFTISNSKPNGSSCWGKLILRSGNSVALTSGTVRVSQVGNEVRYVIDAEDRMSNRWFVHNNASATHTVLTADKAIERLVSPETPERYGYYGRLGGSATPAGAIELQFYSNAWQQPIAQLYKRGGNGQNLGCSNQLVDDAGNPILDGNGNTQTQYWVRYDTVMRSGYRYFDGFAGTRFANNDLFMPPYNDADTYHSQVRLAENDPMADLEGAGFLFKKNKWDANQYNLFYMQADGNTVEIKTTPTAHTLVFDTLYNAQARFQDIEFQFKVGNTNGGYYTDTLPCGTVSQNWRSSDNLDFYCYVAVPQNKTGTMLEDGTYPLSFAPRCYEQRDDNNAITNTYSYPNRVETFVWENYNDGYNYSQEARCTYLNSGTLTLLHRNDSIVYLIEATDIEGDTWSCSYSKPCHRFQDRMAEYQPEIRGYHGASSSEVVAMYLEGPNHREEPNAAFRRLEANFYLLVAQEYGERVPNGTYSLSTTYQSGTLPWDNNNRCGDYNTLLCNSAQWTVNFHDRTQEYHFVGENFWGDQIILDLSYTVATPQAYDLTIDEIEMDYRREQHNQEEIEQGDDQFLINERPYLLFAPYGYESETKAEMLYLYFDLPESVEDNEELPEGLYTLTTEQLQNSLQFRGEIVGLLEVPTGGVDKDGDPDYQDYLAFFPLVKGVLVAQRNADTGEMEYKIHVVDEFGNVWNFNWDEDELTCDAAAPALEVIDWGKNQIRLNMDKQIGSSPLSNFTLQMSYLAPSQATAELEETAVTVPWGNTSVLTDGTFQVPLPADKLETLLCQQIKLQLFNSEGELLGCVVQSVPIVIDQSTTTADNAYFALDDCSHCNVVVLPSATLTKAPNDHATDHNTFFDLTLQAGAKLDLPTGTTTSIHSLTMEAHNQTVSSAHLAGTLTNTTDSLIHLRRLDNKHFYFVTLPATVPLASITQANLKRATHGTHYKAMYYDGAQRITNGGLATNFKDVTETSLTAGQGYILAVRTLGNKEMTLRFPMLYSVAAAAQKNIAVGDYGIDDYLDDILTPNNVGWNLVGNPMLSSYSLADRPILHGQLVEGDFGYELSGALPYITRPVDFGADYIQKRASTETLQPFEAFFVQIGDERKGHTNNLSLLFDQTATFLAPRQAPNRAENEPVALDLELASASSMSDFVEQTGLLMDNRYTAQYEFGADLAKLMTLSSRPHLYTWSGAQKLAYNALPEALADSVAVGFYAPVSGAYTISLPQAVNPRIVCVILTDHLLHTTHSLLTSPYSFEASQGQKDDRFTLSVRLAPAQTSAVSDTKGSVYAYAQDQVICLFGTQINDYITLYNAAGLVLYAGRANSDCPVLSAPWAGCYLIRIENPVTHHTQLLRMVK